MRPLVVLSLLACSLFSTPAFAAWDIFQSYVIIDAGSGNQFLAGGYNADAAATFDGSDLGSFSASDALTLNGGELKTYKNGSSNVCGGNVYYRVYASGDTPGSFSSVALPYDSELANAGDQKWDETAAGIDLLAGLTAGGAYTLEVYWDLAGAESDPAGCGETKFDSDFGNNFTASFTFNVTGCTDPNYAEYDANANTDDSSCATLIDPCDGALVLGSVSVTSVPTAIDAADGEIDIDVTTGTATAVDLTGINGAGDYSFSLPGAMDGILPGTYDASAEDAGGCNSNTVSLIVPYAQCCNGCGVYDVDTDGICDDSDNCFNKSATNYNDPANEACIIPGCIDPAYMEYEATANTDDGSCSTLIIEGCTDGAADNFNSAANTDDGSCIYYGCTNPAYTEYDATANTDDGSCSTLIVEGCTDGAADNYNSAANTDDGSCIYYGCTDPAYIEYDATANADDGSCQCLIVDPACVSPTMDGYSYDVVRIGCQCWFAENLRTTVYADGTVIPAGLTDSEWLAATSGATAVYGQGTSTCNNYSPDIDACVDPAQSLAEYGRLYNWYAATDAAGLCPSGWHVPSDEEWQVLEVELGMFPASANTIGWRQTDEGQKLKSTSGWWEYPVGGYNNGTDDFGFTGLPAGYRSHIAGNSSSAGASAFFWSTTHSSGESAYDLGDRAWGRGLSRNQPRIRRYEYTEINGFSVRCIKD